MREKIQNVFITGGAGYVGAVLVPELLEEGYKVTVLDLMIYGDQVLPTHENLKVIKGDIRDKVLLADCIETQDAVIHLACISNDPSFELDPNLGKSINLDSFEPLVQISKEKQVKRFIYASSSSVYGVKDQANVTEDMTLEPLTDYSKFKAECERILTKYHDECFTTVTIRPATVCGYSPRQRLDVVVNILSNLAYHKRSISIFGGSQMRPNIHIKDMALAYKLLLTAPKEKVANEVFNAGYENHTVEQLGQMVIDVMGPDVEMRKTPTDDNRSYHVSSEKIRDELGFEPRYSIRDAVIDLKEAFTQGLLEDPLTNEMYSNIKRMQSLKLN